MIKLEDRIPKVLHNPEDVGMIPEWLYEDIKIFLDAYKSRKLYDCEWSNLLAAINNAESLRHLTKVQAMFLRSYYLGDC